MIPAYAVLAAVLLLPATALAQDRRAKPAPPLRPSEEVVVTQSASGHELRGYLVELSPTTLAMLVGGKRVEVPLENVLRIEGQNDSVKNGAAIGAAVAGGLTVLGCGASLGRSGVCVTAGIMYTGIGALIGAGIDALHKGRTTIYSKPAAAAVSLAVAPSGKGARAQIMLRW